MSPHLRLSLMVSLRAALQAYEHHQTLAAVRALRDYNQKLVAAEGNGILADRARRLIAQSEAIIGCSFGPHSDPPAAASTVSALRR